MPAYAYIVLKKRAADTTWTCVNWYSSKRDAAAALRTVQMYHPEMQTKTERVDFSDRNRYF
jgi:S-adenosylhomocysteine hydrolase